MSETLRILIVEDDADARENLRDILELDSHFIETVGDYTTLLDASRDLTRFDVVILDRKLPDGMAEDRLPALRARARQADFIVVTGYADLEGTIAAMREGVADYIQKPINPAELRMSLQRIAGRRRIERELSEERLFAEKVLRTAEAIILVLDVRGRIIRFNQFLAEISGYSVEQVQGHDWFDVFIPPDDRERIRELFQRTVQQQESRGVVNPIVTKSGQELIIRWSNSTFKDERGRTTAVLAVGLDITDLVRAQDKLLQTERLATIGQTMTGLAHESRNALQRLQNALENLELEFAERPGVLKDLAKIGRASSDLRDLLDEVQTYAAPIHLRLEQVSLAAIWRLAWENLGPRRAGRDADLLEEQVADSVPIRGDAGRLERVFRNIFENALDACEDPVRVVVSVAQENGCRRVRIRDNGPGIPPRHRKQIFDAFFTSKSSGTGLGLAIVKRIIEAHEGQVGLIATDLGTEFEIVLPIEGAA